MSDRPRRARWPGLRGLGTCALCAFAWAVAGCGGDDGGAGGPEGDTRDASILFPDDATRDGQTLFDVVPGDDAAPDTAPGPDTAPPAGCVEGAGCNDQDACTVNDQCTDGVCAGTPLDCDDGVPCTEDRCAGGSCRHTVASGSCHVDGVCWSADQPNPNNACEGCAPAADPEAWTARVGVECDDGDPCTTGEECAANGSCGGGVTPAEICDDDVDNDCDGHTDDEDPACEPEDPTCAYHDDCYPEQLCGRWRTTGELRCSEPCVGPGGCPAGHICAKVPGSSQVGYCEPTDTALLADGAVCADDADCESRVCADQRCAPLCLDEPACAAADHTCHPVGDLDAGVIMAACAPDSAGALPLGAPCTQDGEVYDAGLCASGHCDLLATTPTCAPLCTREADCAPGQECNLVLRANTANAQTVPYHPQYTQPTYDAAAGCYSAPTGGGAVGAECGQPSHCRSHKCLALIPYDPRTFCTGLCAVDGDCPAGMACKLEAITLTSAWLNAARAQIPDQHSLVRLCKFE